MDRAEYIQKRRRKYLAQVMEELEESVLPLLSKDSPELIENFKGLLRRKFNALAVDAIDVMSLEGDINGYAMEMRDRLHGEGRPTGVRS